MNIFWQDIVGHAQIIKQLRMAIERDRLPHALLFCGEEGIGKKSVARVLAAALLCDTGEETGQTCGECQNCRLNKAGTHPDYSEICPEGGATLKSIKIDKIRRLRQQASSYATMAKRRVFVVDDAHLMNETAQNALLKTIEEPEGNVNFIFVTNTPGMLLKTIVSRCISVNFYPLAAEEVEQVLLKLDFSVADAKNFAAVAGGSVNRALQFGEAGGMALIDDVRQFLINLPTMPLESLLAKSEELAKKPKEHMRDWLSVADVFLHDLLLLKAGGEPNVSVDARRELERVLPSFSKRRLFVLQSIVADGARRISANVNLRLFIEGLFIRMSRE